MADLRWTFGDRLRKVRREAGMSSREFALALGVTNSALAQWETDRSFPRYPLDVAGDIQELTGASVEWLVNGCCLDHCIAIPEPLLAVRKQTNKGGDSPMDFPLSA